MVEGNGKLIGIPKRFEFDHGLMSMSVIVQNMKARQESPIVYCKGAAERIVSLCDPETVPSDFLEKAAAFAKDGCYVLALATRRVYKTHKELKREQIEREGSMRLLGLILFRNELKPDTKQAITYLKEGNTRVAMITGDNAQCGYYIAKATGMIK